MSAHLTRRGLQRSLIGGIYLLIMTTVAIVSTAKCFAVHGLA
jgi:hypothetical protein